LSEEILVKNAEMKNGMLIIKLEKFIPENKKPKLISIK
jgi:HSP20 family molecular chaperone IbpA